MSVFGNIDGNRRGFEAGSPRKLKPVEDSVCLEEAMGGGLARASVEGSRVADESSAASAQTTIVCAIERGRLERQTLLMLEMLRRWGGPLGQSRVLAVLPRRDRRLSAKTLASLDDLGVELLDGSPLNRLPWYNWYGKVVAALVAEKAATTPVIIWLDGDVLIFEPLVDLGLPGGDDFTARRSVVAPAMLGESSPHREFWDFATETVGMSRADIPWLPADGQAPSQSLGFNAGVYAFRRGLGFSEAYADCVLKLMRSRVSFGDGVFWLNEQVAVMLAMLRLRMRYRELPQAENHMVFGPNPSPSIASARLVHYSHMMYPPNWPAFMARVERERPEFHDWLRSRGPIHKPRVSWNPVHMARKIHRDVYSRWHAKRCARAAQARRARRAASPEAIAEGGETELRM